MFLILAFTLLVSRPVTKTLKNFQRLSFLFPYCRAIVDIVFYFRPGGDTNHVRKRWNVKAEKKDVGGGQPSPAERHAGWSGGVT